MWREHYALSYRMLANGMGSMATGACTLGLGAKTHADRLAELRIARPFPVRKTVGRSHVERDSGAQIPRDLSRATCAGSFLPFPQQPARDYHTSSLPTESE